ncbi:hypothetical protein DPM19_13610 [Actinomadura craniellae]|uniref:Tetratricopeptide repeat protein n=1 Tax=Actinomadura craniellae TaxID=2231787 RepID=A0A365H6S1_9ACTN|nr:FxSxx-COOH system tetratricopeptide repeat protein [Actinomadura craniellae]RAY14771.1 hypothetical protein DPM19_13610 [Actinomadura craniellae]
MRGDIVHKIVGFRGYQSGLGVSKGLANIAWILGSHGRRVLIVDWTDHQGSPTLLRHLGPYMDVRPDSGLRQLAEQYERSWLPGSGDHDGWEAPAIPFADQAVVLKMNFDWRDPALPPPVEFLARGDRVPDNGGGDEPFTWERFLSEPVRADFIKDMGASLRNADFDHILIDTDQGSPDLADAALELLDVLVYYFPGTEDGLRPSRAKLDELVARAGADLRVLPVSGRVDARDPRDQSLMRRRIRAAYEGLPVGDPASRDRYWNGTEVPAWPTYGRAETMAAVAEDPRHLYAMIKPYENITAAVLGEEEFRVIPLEEHAREEELHRVQRSLRNQRPRVGLLSAPCDVVWREWIGAVLHGLGVETSVEVVGDGESPDVLRFSEDPSPLLVVMSSGFEGTPESNLAGALWHVTADPGASAPSRDVVGAKVSELSEGAVLPSHVIDLLFLPEAGARQELGRRFGDLGQESPAGRLSVRYPARYPALDSLPAQDREFVGRNEIIARLREQLPASGRNGRPMALVAPGGLGKSAIALEYAWRYRSQFDIVWWIEARNAGSAREELERLAGGFLGGEQAEDAVHVMLRKLQRGEVPEAIQNTRSDGSGADNTPETLRWLLVYNDAPKDDSLLDLLAVPGPGGQVLVTSRDEQWAERADVIRVEHLPGADASELLARRAKGNNILKPVATDLSDAVRNEPLPIQYLKGYMDVGPSQITYRGSTDLAIQLLKRLEAGEDTSPPLARVLDMVLPDLARVSPGADLLLHCSVFLAARGANQELLGSRAMVEAIAEADETVRSGDRTFGELLGLLSKYRLARIDQRTGRLSVHQKTCRAVIDRLSEERRESLRERIQQLVAAFAPPDHEIDDPRHDGVYREVALHLEPAGMLSRETSSWGTEIRRAIVNTLRFHYRQNQLTEVERVAPALIEQWAARFGKDDPLLLRLRVQWANVLRARSRYEECMRIDQDVLQRQTNLLPLNHPHVLKTQGSLAADYRGRGDFLLAKGNDANIHTTMRIALGDEHLDTLGAANNLALDLVLTGDINGALTFNQEIYRILQGVFGDLHPRTIRAVTSLGIRYGQLGQYEVSRELLEMARQRRVTTRSMDGPDGFKLLNALSISLRGLGHSDAAALARTAYQGIDAIYGPDNLYTLTSAVSLAAALHAEGSSGEALDLARKYVDGMESLLPPVHPFISLCRANLAVYARAVGSGDLALEAAETAYQGLADSSSLGRTHPFTLIVGLGLANSLITDSARRHEAEALDSAAAEALGSLLRGRPQDGEHPHAAVARRNLDHTRSLLAGRESDETRGEIELDLPGI